MKNKKLKLKVLITALAVTGVAAGLAAYTLASSVDYTSYDAPYISPSDISIAGDYAFVADATLDKVYKASLADQGVKGTWDAGRTVNGVVANGTDVFALSGELDGTVTKLDANLKKVAEAEAGHTPVAAVVKGDKLYVANRFTNNVKVYNTSDLSKGGEDIEVGREPMAMTVVGDKIYVAKHLSEDAANDEDGTAARVAVIDTTKNNAVTQIRLTNGSDGVKSIVASEDGKYVYVSHVLARYAYPTSQLDRGWVNTNAISVIDAAADKLITSVLLDEVELGAPNPWGLAINGKQLVVSISGSNQVFTIDTDQLMSRIEDVKAGKNEKVKTVEAIADYLPFLDGLRNKIDLSGEGAREIAVADGKAYVCQYFTGDVEVLDLKTSAVTGTISLGNQPEANAVRTGEILWFTANNTYQKWESCASCHPEGRAGSFNWDELGDGIGNDKSTKSLVYSHRTPPVLVTGCVDTAEQNVRGSVQSADYTEEQLNCLDEYLKSMTPVQSPYLNRDGTLTKEAEEGKKLFESEGCVTCHPAPLYTDMEKHASAIINDEEKNPTWEKSDMDTPTLIEVWRSGPYFFNGCFKTLREAVEASLKPDSKLTDEQIDNLTEFVASIGNQNEYYGVEQVRSTSADGTEKINALQQGSMINSITLKKQLDTTQQAKVTFTLYKKDGTKIGGSEMTETLKADMKVGDTAKIKTEINVPDSLEKGDYAVITITDAADGSAKLATDLKLVY